MESPTSVEMMKSIELVQALKDSGILFVPIPVLGKEDNISLLKELARRLDIILPQVE